MILVGVVGAALLVYGWMGGIKNANDWGSLLQALFTLGAFSLAAHWYFAERKGMPHADLSQTIQAHALGDDTIAVEAHVKIKNIGERQLIIQEIQSHLQDVDARTYGYVALARLGDDQYWRSNGPEPVMANSMAPSFDGLWFECSVSGSATR